VVAATLQEPLGEPTSLRGSTAQHEAFRRADTMRSPTLQPGVEANIGTMHYIVHAVNFTASRHRETV
jgi:hypothetical protein